MSEQKELCSKRIEYALELRNMKQADLVERTGIGKSAISQYLSGKYVPKQKATHLIAKALDVSEAWLMGYDVPMGRIEDGKGFASEEERKLLGLFHRLDKHDKEELFKWIDFRLTDSKYNSKKESLNA